MCIIYIYMYRGHTFRTKESHWTVLWLLTSDTVVASCTRQTDIIECCVCETSISTRNGLAATLRAIMSHRTHIASHSVCGSASGGITIAVVSVDKELVKVGIVFV